MKVVIWGINYSPEVTGIAVYNTMLAEWLAERGHGVSVVSTFPYYPAWRKAPGDRRLLFRTDDIERVAVHRCWHYVPAKVTALRRMVHEASFVCLSFLRLLTLRRPDVLVVVSPPLPLGVAAWAYRLFRRVPYVFHVQDLQPDAAAGLGMLEGGRLVRFLYRIESLSYARADRVSGISREMLKAFTRKKVPEEKQVYFPNPVSLPDSTELPARGGFRQKQGIAEDRFLVVYSGNLGVKQGLDQVIDAASRFRDSPEVTFLICGEGAQKESLRQRVSAEDLTNVRFLPLQPEDDFHRMLADADLSLVTQQAGSGASFFPSKLLNLFARLSPVLATADENSVVRTTLTEHACGLVVAPGDTGGFVEAVEEARQHPEKLRLLAENGRRYVERFSKDAVLEKFEEELLRLAGGGKARGSTEGALES